MTWKNPKNSSAMDALLERSNGRLPLAILIVEAAAPAMVEVAGGEALGKFAKLPSNAVSATCNGEGTPEPIPAACQPDFSCSGVPGETVCEDLDGQVRFRSSGKCGRVVRGGKRQCTVSHITDTKSGQPTDW